MNKKILYKASVFITVLIMVFSSIGLMANKIDIYSSEIDFINVGDLSFIKLSDKIPSSSCDPDWLYFHTGYAENAMGITYGGTFEAAIRLTSDEFQPLYCSNCYITKMKFYHHVYEDTSQSHSGEIKIYGEGTPATPGPLKTSEPYTVVGDGWFEVSLSSPCLIKCNEDLWISVEITHATGEYPIGIDAGPAVVGKGDWLYYDENWTELSPNYDVNWCIEAKVECFDGPMPYITIPGNDGLLNDCGSWQTIVIGEDTLIRAVDMNNKADIMLAIFEYYSFSSDYPEWITIGVDEYGGFEGEYLEGGEDIKIGDEGWSVEWYLSDFDEGYYYIRVTMIDVFERSGVDNKLVYYDPTPPIPNFTTLEPYTIIDGICPIEVFSLDEDIVSYELGLWIIAPPLDYYWKDNLGTENQFNVGPNGKDGINRYCVPTAIKNSLHRFVHNGDTNLEPPLPWYPARNSPLNFTDKRYVVPKGGDADLAMARMLSEELGTTPDGGTTSIKSFTLPWGEVIHYTDSITSGIRSYLNKRGVGCSNPNGYTVTTYGTIYKETPDGRWQPDSSNINYNTYESELRKCEDVILDLHIWDAGKDGKLGTNDDDIGGGHAVTGRSSNACPNFPDNSNDIDFVDPHDGTVVNSKWKDYNGFPGVEYNGQTWLVSGMWSISPKQRDLTEYLSIGVDNSVSDGWVFYWDTTTFEDGFYVISATLEDSEGFCGRANMMIEIDNIVNNPPEKPICSYDSRNDYLKVTSTDMDGDQIRYGISWNNDQSVDKWTTFFNSGEEITINCEDHKGIIGVIAEDTNGASSDWVSIKTKNKEREYSIINLLFQRYFQLSTLFEKILKQII